MKPLVYLYPRAWRARYGEEFLALLDEQPATPRVAVDLIWGAVDAHLRLQTPPASPEPAAMDRAGTGRAAMPPPIRGSLCANLAMGMTLVHIELVLRLVALCDAGLRDYLRELSATSAPPGPFIVPKFLCGGAALATYTRDAPGRPRPPIITTGVRRPIATVQPWLVAAEAL